MSITAPEIVVMIQKIKNVKCPQMKFLVSLAHNAYTFGSLTEKQTNAYQQAVETLRKNGNIDL